MVSTFTRNGTGPRAFPQRPLLLAPVSLPHGGDYEGIVVQFNAGAVRELLDNESAGLLALTADLRAEELDLIPQVEAAQAAGDTATRTALLTRQDAILLEQCLRLIQATVHRVDWAYTDAPPDPADPLAFADTLGDFVTIWIAQRGLYQVGAQFGGFLSQYAMLHGF
jgi:hypothetical protein